MTAALVRVGRNGNVCFDVLDSVNNSLKASVPPPKCCSLNTLWGREKNETTTLGYWFAPVTVIILKQITEVYSICILKQVTRECL